MKKCFDLANVLLPKKGIELGKWSVIACDQYTSQPEYWDEVEKIVGKEPSMLHMIFPEVYLEKDNWRIDHIHKTMNEYLSNGILEPSKEEQLILVERTTESGVRLGIIGKIDLEQYDFSSNSQTLIRASEETVISRIPPRVNIRRGARIESPHVMLLYDDPECKIIEPLYEKIRNREILYEFELMLGGGKVKGYEVVGKEATEIVNMFQSAQERSKGLLFAVGDGNHSLATAKVCWERMKHELSDEEIKNHPARYALVEVTNLHSQAINFEPIHRILFSTKLEEFLAYMVKELEKQNMYLTEGEDLIFLFEEKSIGFNIINKEDRIVVDILQKIIDSYIDLNPNVKQDYVHGKENLEELVRRNNGIGIVLQAISKTTFFPGIRAGGVLPRKTFSMGNACEKRYYLECRSLM